VRSFSFCRSDCKYATWEESTKLVTICSTV
jgi:hypothetical protein